jgi:putative endonuclease
MSQRYGYVYIMASGRHGTLYIGVTNDIARRAFEHRTGVAPGFTRRYGLKRLVWYEIHDTVPDAIQREKTLKRWLRTWKIALIEQANPEWRDLWDELTPEV